MSSPVEFDPTVEDWPTDPHELLAFVQGIPDDGQRRLATAMARALIQYQAVVVESSQDRADLRERLDSLDATVTAVLPEEVA